MQKATQREHESATLEVLHTLDILDTSAEPEFDALVEAASRIGNMPIALVSFVAEDRQWFKAQIGMPELSETPRDIAFCAHAVLEKDVFEVPDALQDSRFADNPLVAGSPGIRFYAGAPLSIANGLQIGTLCIMDTLPRQLTADERKLLKDLANAVVHAIEVRFAKRKLGTLRSPTILSRATTVELVVDAMSTVEVALDQLFGPEGQSPAIPTTDLMGLAPAEKGAVDAFDRAAYQAKPAMTAMHFCLTASSALLGITRELLHSAQYMTPLQRERAWKQLAADTKIAGRAAYRAALVLADPLADQEG